MGKRLSTGEFTVLVALLFALIAAGSDTMLPALGLIGDDLRILDANDVQLVITIFFLGTGIGQLIAGPLSDTLGRKVVIGGGIVIFIFSSVWCAYASDFTSLLIGRFIQGLGISAPRSAGNAMVRDIYKGRQMARVVSLAMMIFVIVPATTPLLGQSIMLAFNWRAIFWAFVILGLIAFLWLIIRQEETHPIEARKPFRISRMIFAFKEVLTNKRVVLSMLCISLLQAILFSFISTAQQVYVEWLDVGEKFPLYFAAASLVAALSYWLNARLVERLGMWLLSLLSMVAIFTSTAIMIAVTYYMNFDAQTLLAPFIVWTCSLFFLVSFCFGNLNAMSMEPMGHIAGTASAVIGAIATSLSIIVAIGVGRLYDGTGLPLLISISILSLTALVLNFFNPQNV